MSEHIAKPSVVIAMATYRRPDCLRRVLPHLVLQLDQVDVSAKVIVIDNNPEPTGRATVEKWRDQGVRYVHEPIPGIAAARNRALDEARDHDALIFIDDDEIPLPGWLSHLVTHWLEWKCAAISGPVIPEYSGPVDPWVQAVGVFDRRRNVEGRSLLGAATNNLLLDLKILRAHSIRFDERFGFSGGEDTMLTRQLVRSGEVIRWCDHAEVRESVPAERATRAWVMKRTLRTSSAWSAVALALAGSGAGRARVRLSIAVHASYRLIQGCVQALWGVICGELEPKARGQIAIASGFGMLLGTVGYVRREYRRV